MHLNLRNINRILVRTANWIGDAVMTLPALRAIRKNFPNAEITLLAKPWVAPVFENCSDSDHMLIYDAQGRHSGFAGKFRLARDLKGFQFDAAILFQNAFEAALVTLLASIPNRIGYDTDARSLLLSHAIPCTPDLKQVHQIEYYLGILRGAGLRADDMDLSLELSPEERRGASAFLGRHGIIWEERVVIGISPGATFGTAKRWFPERYVALCQRLQDAEDADILVFGGSGEATLGDWIGERVGKRCTNLCGRTTLREAMALIETCRVFITNDSGLMHIGAALGVPLVAIFGSTDYVTTSPAGTRSQMVRVPTPCSPCLKPDCPEEHHRCMKAITVEMVYGAVSSKL